jgi:hypothetical protein
LRFAGSGHRREAIAVKAEALLPRSSCGTLATRVRGKGTKNQVLFGEEAAERFRFAGSACEGGHRRRFALRRLTPCGTDAALLQFPQEAPAGNSSLSRLYPYLCRIANDYASKPEGGFDRGISTGKSLERRME